ncbi:MAG: hypothetical protein WCS77_05485 [Elusimicrobiaceae bacterium]
MRGHGAKRKNVRHAKCCCNGVGKNGDCRYPIIGELEESAGEVVYKDADGFWGKRDLAS